MKVQSKIASALIGVLFLTIFNTANSEYVRRRGFAKKYLIPKNLTHIPFGEASQKALKGDSIKVLVWNILKGKRKKFERDFKKLAKVTDLYVLQEGFHNEKNQRIMGNINGIGWDFCVSFLWMKQDETPGGTILGSKADPTMVDCLRTHDLEPIIKTPKTLAIAKYPIEGHDKELLVISIHGINFTTTQTLQTQMKMAEDYMKTHDGPVIFAGDFNTRNWDRFNAMVDVVNRNQLTPVIFKEDKRIKPFGTYLDHAYVRGLKIKDSKVLRDLKSSDHKAMYVEVSL